MAECNSTMTSFSLGPLQHRERESTINYSCRDKLNNNYSRLREMFVHYTSLSTNAYISESQRHEISYHEAGANVLSTSYRIVALYLGIDNYVSARDS